MPIFEYEFTRTQTRTFLVGRNSTREFLQRPLPAVSCSLLPPNRTKFCSFQTRRRKTEDFFFGQQQLNLQQKQSTKIRLFCPELPPCRLIQEPREIQALNMLTDSLHVCIFFTKEMSVTQCTCCHERAFTRARGKETDAAAAKQQRLGFSHVAWRYFFIHCAESLLLFCYPRKRVTSLGSMPTFSKHAGIRPTSALTISRKSWPTSATILAVYRCLNSHEGRGVQF